MSLRFVFFTVVIFATVVHVIDGCSKKSGKPRNKSFVRKAREVDVPIFVGESGFGLLLRPRNTRSAPKGTEAKGVFRSLDTNNDGIIDAAEWVDFSKKSSVWDFVELLDYVDLDDDEAISLAEFLSVQIVGVNLTEQDRDDVAVTSS